MDDGQKEWLAEHLGHEFKIHKNNYVLQEPIIELAKISRLLIAVENGDAAMFVGKKLQDISTEGMFLGKPRKIHLATCDVRFGQEEEKILPELLCSSSSSSSSSVYFSIVALSFEQITGLVYRILPHHWHHLH